MKFPQTKIYFSIFIIIAAGFSIPVGAVFVPNFNIDLLNLNEFGDLDSGFTGSDAASSYLIPNKLRLKETWQLLNEQTVPLSPIKIGIIDNRIDISHPEFGGVNFGNTPPIAKSLPPSSPSSHGMAVAGIIGSNNVSSSSPTNYIPPHMNGILSGANKLKYTLELRSPDLELFGVRVTEIGTAFGFRQAITKLDKENVNIINVSEGFGAFGGRMALIRRKLERLSNILFVVGSGNDGKDANDISPANLGDDLENVITVGFVDNSDQRSSVNGNSSNFGDAVNLSAPGVNVFTPGFFASPFDLSDYQPFSGTSASAPMVTGVAGLIKAIKPNLSPAEIKQILTESADPITASTTEEIDKKLGSACNDGRPGFRGCRLNALAAVCHRDVLNCVPPPPLPSEEGFIVFIFPKIGIPTKLIRVTADGIQTDIFDFGKRISGDGVVIDSNGDFIVLATSELLRITAGGVATRIFNGNNIPIGTRCGLATDSNGNFIVMVDSVLSRITPEGMQTEIFEFPSGVEPRGITVASNGDFIVTELGINTLSRVTRQGVRIPLFIFDPQQLGFGVAIDP